MVDPGSKRYEGQVIIFFGCCRNFWVLPLLTLKYMTIIADLLQLSKFTNVVKGWQYRWFVLEPEAGRLEYHLLEDRSVGLCD